MVVFVVLGCIVERWGYILSSIDKTEAYGQVFSIEASLIHIEV